MKLKTTKGISYWVSVAIIGITLGCVIQFAKAWTEPTATAPDGNVGAPINTSDILQNKAGSLGVSGAFLDVLNSLFVHGNVGVGTQTPNPDKGASGNIDVNDVYLRSTGKWLSEMSISGNAGTTIGPLYTREVKTTDPIYCFSGDTMVGGGCWGRDVCDDSDSSGYGGRPIGENGWQCMNIGCTDVTAYIRCTNNSGRIFLYGTYHSTDDCTSAGGILVSDGDKNFCKFSQSSCPSGGHHIKTFNSRRKLAVEQLIMFQNVQPFRTTSSHVFSNASAETCKVDNYRYINYWFDYTCSAYDTSTCTATITERGCY